MIPYVLTDLVSSLSIYYLVPLDGNTITKGSDLLYESWSRMWMWLEIKERG